MAVFNAKEKVYATAARPGTLDEAIDYFINDLDMRFPLAELFSSGSTRSGGGLSSSAVAVSMAITVSAF